MRFYQKFLNILVLALLCSGINTQTFAQSTDDEPTIEELMAAVPEGASRVADHRPYWSHCLDDMPADPQSCTDRDVHLFLTKNAKRPATSTVGGSLIMDYDINELGEVDWALVIRGVNKEVDAAAMALVKSLPPFMPAMRDGKPIRYRQTVRIAIP